MDEKPPSSTWFVVESLEVVLDEKLLLGEKQSGRKILLDENPPSLIGFVVESLEVVLDEKLLFGEKQSVGEENPVG